MIGVINEKLLKNIVIITKTLLQQPKTHYIDSKLFIGQISILSKLNFNKTFCGTYKQTIIVFIDMTGREKV